MNHYDPANNPQPDQSFRVAPPNSPTDQVFCPNCRGGNPTVAQSCMWCSAPLAAQAAYRVSAAGGDTPYPHYPPPPQYGQPTQQLQPYQHAPQQPYPVAHYAPYPPPPPPQPYVIHNTHTVVIGNQKSVGLAVFLAFLFGPLGMLYSTVTGAIVIFLLNLAVLSGAAYLIALTLTGTGGGTIGLLWIVGMIWAGAAASSHNKQIMESYHSTTYGPSYR
jgi:hypothetical protein